MRLHLKNIATGEIKRNVKYANADVSIPVVGLDENLQYYYEDVDQTPQHDGRTHQISRMETFTDEVHPEHAHLKKLSVTWQLTQKSDEEIIASLNEAVGSHLDDNYPLPIRVKHLKEGVELALLTQAPTQDQLTRLNYLTALGNWLNTCRLERDVQEAAFTQEGVLPTFQFTEKP